MNWWSSKNEYNNLNYRLFITFKIHMHKNKYFLINYYNQTVILLIVLHFTIVVLGFFDLAKHDDFYIPYSLRNLFYFAYIDLLLNSWQRYFLYTFTRLLNIPVICLGNYSTCIVHLTTCTNIFQKKFSFYIWNTIICDSVREKNLMPKINFSRKLLIKFDNTESSLRGISIHNPLPFFKTESLICIFDFRTYFVHL